MTSKSSNSDSSSNESNVTRFTLDGVVAEMVVEVDDHQDALFSPTKALRLNRSNYYENLKPSTSTLDPISKMDDDHISNIETQKQIDSDANHEVVNISSRELQEEKTLLQSDISDKQGISMNEESNASEIKEDFILIEDKQGQTTEMLEKNCTQINEDGSAVDGVMRTKEDEFRKQTEKETQIKEAVDTESVQEKENKSPFYEETNTIAKSEDVIAANEFQSSKDNKNKSTIEVTETNELPEKDNKLAAEKLSQTNEDQLSEKGTNKLAAEEIAETIDAQLLKKDGDTSYLEEKTETKEAQKLKENESQEISKTNEIQVSRKNESVLVGKEVADISEAPLSEKNEKEPLDRLTKTVVVGCESTELKLTDIKGSSPMKKSLKLPLKKRKIIEPEKTDEDVPFKDEDEPKTRTLRSRPSEKDKKEVKNTNTNKRRDSSGKSISVPFKKAKHLNEESLKRGQKRGSPTEDKTEVTVKRLRSSTQDSSQIQRRSQASSSKTPETKNRKSELKDKKSEIKNLKLETKNKKPEIKSKMSGIKEKKPEMKDTPEIKRQSLRKTQLRKSANIHVPMTSSKPKVYNLNRGTETNLGTFSEIKGNVKESDMKYLRYLYRILYDQWPPKDLDELKKEILNFEGFNFKKKSQDLQKREQVLKKMPDASIVEICKILDLTVGSKENMISDIIKFLLKPVKVVISTVDPFDPSLQPVVKLERISPDDYFKKKTKKKNKIPVPVKRSKRERYPSTKLEIYVSDISEKNSVSTTKDEQQKSQIENKKEKGSKSESTKNTTLKQNTINKTKTADKSSVKRNEQTLAVKYVKRKKRRVGYRLAQKKKAMYNQTAREKLMKLAVKIQETKSPVKEINEIDSSAIPKTEVKHELITEDAEIKESTDIEEAEALNSSKIPTKQETNSMDSSSDATLSSDEAKEMTKTDSPRKRISHIRAGKPLRYFTKIKENILNANFSALQRLHILLFGASDKADNLKGNILAFGGFPFLEGSEEWKQKEFLLSLLAQNTLREYLNLLCIEYTDDDQKALISKLMKFLAAPSNKPVEDEIRTQVISSEPVSCAPVHSPKAPIKRKKAKKPEEKKKCARKVLMDEAQVKRLEADLAREQRILEREKKLLEEQRKKVQPKPKVTPENNGSLKPILIQDKILLPTGLESSESLEKKAVLTAKQTDVEMLNALLETVYKRRALKEAGVVISAPKKDSLTRLGELANVKFLVVTANYSDLDVLHHLIYMTEANKSKVRKNILDFAGFNFAEDSQAYQDRMKFLNSLGYDISKRIAFLLGLCPFKTEIDQQDLNELIMYFLMHPCKSKQIPIRHLPQTFFRKDIPKEICQLMQKHLVDLPVSTASPSTNEIESSPKKQPEITVIEDDEPPAPIPVRQKAKKSFKSCLPSVQRKGLSPSISTLPLSAPKPVLKPLKPSQPVLLPGQTNKIFLPALGRSPQPTLQNAVLKPAAPAITIPSTSNAPQEVLIQQQTPDGQQKTFKLIKLPSIQPTHSGAQSVLKNSPQQTSLIAPAPISSVVQSNPLTFAQPVQVNPIVNNSLPPGLIFFKNSPQVSANQSLPSIVQTVPSIVQTVPSIVQTVPSIVQTVPIMLNAPAMNISPIVSVANTNQETSVAPEEEKLNIPVECEYGEESVEELNPLADSNPPTDEDLFNSIQEVIHSSDFENITLKNVIDRVSSQYSSFDLTHRHLYMKECIKKIIMGT